MGCGGSKELQSVYPEEWVVEFTALQFNMNEIVKLEAIFHRIDDSADGRVDLSELLDYIGLDRSDFAKRVFSIFDSDGSGTIDFREFILSLWNFCSCSDASLRMFAFDLYDRDASGKIEVKEVEQMMREVYGAGFDSSQHAQRLMEKIKALTGGNNVHSLITLDQFAAFSKDNPALLFPAFEMQRKIQTKVMGESFWRKILERRIALTDDGSNFVSVKQILAMKVNKSTFQELVEAPLEKEARLAARSGDKIKGSSDAKTVLDNAGVRGTRGEQQGTTAYDRAHTNARAHVRGH